MKHSGIHTIPSKTTGNTPSEDKRKIDDAIIKKNPNVDTQLLSDFYKSIDGVIQRGKGANYSLSHPLGSNAVPNSIRKKENEVENT